MTPSHHPSDETLLALAAGTVNAGPRLVLETHLAGCGACRDRVRACEAAGGALLRDAAPAMLPPHLLAGALARLDAVSAPREPRRHQAPPELRDAPPPLLRCDFGRWRFLQPGLRISRVTIPDAPEANVIMLKVGAGLAVPRHTHDGTEYTQVLTGAFSDALGHYRAGDCIEADEDIDHQPLVDRDAECICLAAVDGRLRLHSFVARLLQPLLGI